MWPTVAPDLYSFVFSATTSVEMRRICQIPRVYLMCNMAHNSTFELHKSMTSAVWIQTIPYISFVQRSNYVFVFFVFLYFPFFFWSFKASLFSAQRGNCCRTGDGAVPARELVIAGRGCWWGSVFGCSRQLLSRGFPLPGCHAGKGSIGPDRPGLAWKKRQIIGLMGGSGELLDKRTDPLWLGGVSEAPGGAGGSRLGVGRGCSSGSSWRSWRRAWILTAVKSPSDTLSHTSRRHTHTHSHGPPPHAQESSGIHLSQPVMKQANVFFVFFEKAHMYTHTQTQRHTHTPSKENYLFHPHDQRSATELLYTWTCWRWTGDSRQDGEDQSRQRENMCLGRTESSSSGTKGIFVAYK